jgi:hypothetical protein
MMLWGVVALQLRPSSRWWAVLQAAAAVRVQQMAPRDVAQVGLGSCCCVGCGTSHATTIMFSHSMP